MIMAKAFERSFTMNGTRMERAFAALAFWLGHIESAEAECRDVERMKWDCDQPLSSFLGKKSFVFKAEFESVMGGGDVKEGE